MVIPQPTIQKNRDFEPLSPSYVKNTGSRAPAVGPMGVWGQKDLEKKCWNLTENHQKRKKSNLPSNCAEFRQESPGNFFFDFGPVWPTFGHFTVSGRYGLYRGAGPKRLSINLKCDQKSPKRKKSNIPSKCAEFRQESRDNFFFGFGPVLTHFWPFY